VGSSCRWLRTLWILIMNEHRLGYGPSTSWRTIELCLTTSSSWNNLIIMLSPVHWIFTHTNTSFHSTKVQQMSRMCTGAYPIPFPMVISRIQFNFVGHEFYCLKLNVVDLEKYFTNSYETWLYDWTMYPKQPYWTFKDEFPLLRQYITIWAFLIEMMDWA